MSDRNQESDMILSVYKISVGFHRISIGIRYGSDRFLSVPIIGLNDLGNDVELSSINDAPIVVFESSFYNIGNYKIRVLSFFG